MPVSNENSVSGPYYPNGATTGFAFDFKAASTSEVVAVDADGNTISPALYSVSLDDDEGGTLTFGTAPSAADYPEIYVVSNPALTQPSDFDNAGPSYNPAALTRAFDRAAVRDLKQQRQIDASLKVPFGETPPLVGSLAGEDGKALGIVSGRIVPVANDVAGAEQIRVDVEAVAAAVDIDAAAAVTARGAAEDARDDAVAAKEGAETAQVLAEVAQVAAEAVTQAASDALAAGTVSDLVGTRIYASRAALNADLVPADNLYALVVGDPTPANNDLYQKNGATTTGSWDGPLGLFASASAAAQAAADSVAALFETVNPTNLYNPADKQSGKYVNGSGGIAVDAAWACTDYIPVVAGQKYTISWGSGSKRAGLAFYATDGATVAVAGSYTATSTNPLTVTAPAGANFMVVNIKSNTIAEPPYLMINAGDTPLPYEAWFAPYEAVSGVASGPVLDAAAAAVDASLSAAWVNYFDRGDFVGGWQPTRTASPVVELAQQVFVDRGIDRGIQWRAGNEYFRYASGGSLLNKYFFTAFIVSSVDASNLWTSPTTFKESALGALTSPADVSSGYIPLSSTSRILWAMGRIDTDVPNFVSGSHQTPAVAGTLFASGAVLFLSDAPLDRSEAFRQMSIAAKARREARRWARSVENSGGGDTGARSRLVLNGTGGVAFVESDRSGHTVRNDFVPFPVASLTTLPCRLNLDAQYLDGVALRTGSSDDIAPDHAEGATIGGNHGYTLGRCTAAAHGKTASDQGSRWSSGGSNHVLVLVEDANTLLIAREDANSAPATGTFAHVSGAVATGNITVTAVASIQWYPPHTDYEMRVYVDGGLIDAVEGEWSYGRDVQFVETCDILPRSAIIAWWIANGGATGGLVPDGAADYRMATTHRFDCDGQLTIHRDWIMLAPTSVVDLMGLQVARIATPDTYRIPGAEPFTYDSETLDYGAGVASGRTLTAGGTPNIYFDVLKLQLSGGEYAHRLISEWDDAAFAVGLLPVGDAAYDVRRARVSNQAMEIRGNTAKVYFRVLDKGSFTAAAGDTYSAVGFRHILPRVDGRPLVCPVRLSDRKAILYIDWTDSSGFDRVDVPPDLVGRTITVLDSRNAALVGTGLAAGSVTADVSAGGDHGYLVLEFAA